MARIGIKEPEEQYFGGDKPRPQSGRSHSGHIYDVKKGKNIEHNSCLIRVFVDVNGPIIMKNGSGRVT